MNAMEEFHLTVETLFNGTRVSVTDLHDPFLHHVTTTDLSFWDWLSLLWRGRRIVHTIKIRGDDIAHRQWFRTDPLPGGAIGRTFQTKPPVQDAAARGGSAPPDRAEH
jgi:hypothetical protein